MLLISSSAWPASTATQTTTDKRFSSLSAFVALALLNGQITVATSAQITEFKLQQIAEGGVQIITLSGYMGNAEFREAHKALARLLEQKHSRVILDLTRLSFITTMSLARFLVCARKFRRHGGKLKLAGLSPELSRFAEMAGFNAQQDFEPDVATALKALSQLPGAQLRRLAKKK